MKIEADGFVDYPAQQVFETYRDALPALVEGIPQIREIVVESREARGDRVHLVNIWHGDTPVPKVAEKILPMKISWRDHAAWDATNLRASWTIESETFSEAVHCHGEHRFVDVGGCTRVEVRGEIRIDLSRLRLVPDMVASPIAKAIERFAVAQFTPSASAVCDALQDYLDEQGG